MNEEGIDTKKNNDSVSEEIRKDNSGDYSRNN